MRVVTKMVVAVLSVAIICSGCTRTVYQDREVVRRDSIYITALSVDTVMQRDSIHIREKGDTVYKTVYQYKYKVRERTDTCFVERTDTVTMTETKVETRTERKNNWLELIGCAVVALIVGLLAGRLSRILFS